MCQGHRPLELGSNDDRAEEPDDPMLMACAGDIPTKRWLRPWRSCHREIDPEDPG